MALPAKAWHEPNRRTLRVRRSPTPRRRLTDTRPAAYDCRVRTGRRGVALLMWVTLAAPAWALDFAPCAEAGHEAFDCATLTVPLDRSGTVAGTVDLSIERLRQPTADLPVLLALAGGPGQSATSFDAVFAAVFDGVLDRYQLVVFDQRGTGRSGVLDCPALRVTYGEQTIAMCAESLGPAAELYTTADSVLDVDAVRTALGVDRLAIAGISYGTHVALEYARTFPDHVATLVLDSNVPPDGISALEVESFAAVARVLGEICSGGSCTGFTADPVADTAALVRRLARPLRGIVVDPAGRRQRATIGATDLFGILEAGDLLPLLQARFPGAVAAALHGDKAPLLRLRVLLALAPLGADVDPAVRADSVTLLLATFCADTRFPWNAADVPQTRAAALDAAAANLPPQTLFPFDAPTAAASGGAPSCVFWPPTALARARSSSPVPDVPALVLGGTRDLRTPLESDASVAALLPRATRVVVPSRGHSVLTGAACARAAMTSYLHDTAIGDPCAGLVPTFPTEPPPPRSLRQLNPGGLPGIRGRVLAAVIKTLNDAIATAATVVPQGGAVQVGGLRAGRVTGTVDASTFHLALERYTFVRGVVIDGSIDFVGQSPTAQVRIRGRMPGQMTFAADGSASGRLGGRTIVLTPNRSLARGESLLRAHTVGLPPIR
jgi:pimeloyl-ACP methyl ester carboxylesterase